RGLAGAARPGEEVRLAELPVRDRVAQRAHDRLLPDHLVEALRAVLPVERGHWSDSSRESRSGRAGRTMPHFNRRRAGPGPSPTLGTGAPHRALDPAGRVERSDGGPPLAAPRP